MLFRKNTSLKETLQCAVASSLHMVDKVIYLFINFFIAFDTECLKFEKYVWLVHHLWKSVWLVHHLEKYCSTFLTLDMGLLYRMLCGALALSIGNRSGKFLPVNHSSIFIIHWKCMHGVHVDTCFMNYGIVGIGGLPFHIYRILVSFIDLYWTW